MPKPDVPTALPSDRGATTLSKRAWGMLLVLCGALFLDALDVSMVGVALPSIQADLGMSTSSLQWVVSAYVLGYGGFLLFGRACCRPSWSATCVSDRPGCFPGGFGPGRPCR